MDAKRTWPPGSITGCHDPTLQFAALYEAKIDGT